MTAGAARVHRSQSAVSLQIKQLEDIVGQRVFRRLARGIELTETGNRLLPVARQTIHSLDRTLDELQGSGLSGKIRIGLPDDHSHSVLADIVADFADRHPDVELEVHCAFGAGFGEALDRGLLDLAVYEVSGCGETETVLRHDKLIWARSRKRDPVSATEMPVALFDRDCWWRDTALSSLDANRINYRVVFTSESAIGVHAAVQAGIASALMRASDVRGDLAPATNIAVEIPSYLVLKKAPAAAGPVLDAMVDAIQRAFRSVHR